MYANQIYIIFLLFFKLLCAFVFFNELKRVYLNYTIFEKTTVFCDDIQYFFPFVCYKCYKIIKQNNILITFFPVKVAWYNLRLLPKNKNNRKYYYINLTSIYYYGIKYKRNRKVILRIAFYY